MAAKLNANSGIDVSTTRRGPKRSTSMPCSGDITTIMYATIENANETSERSQPNSCSIGVMYALTVRFAITLGPNARPIVAPSVSACRCAKLRMVPPSACRSLGAMLLFTAAVGAACLR